MTSDRPHTGTGQRPFWLIGSILLGFVLLVLAAAFLLDRQFRAPVGTQTAVAPAAGASAGATSQGQAAAVQVPWQRIARTPLEREVEEAYARYWQVRAQAYLDLNPELLGQVMAGAELQREQEQLADLKRRGRAGLIDADHRITFREVSPGKAVIYDEYLNKSVLLDATTKQRIPTNETPNTERVTYELNLVGGAWKVVDGALQD